MAEAQLKEAEAIQRKHPPKPRSEEAEARGPLREERSVLSYADPKRSRIRCMDFSGIPKEAPEDLRHVRRPLGGRVHRRASILTAVRPRRGPQPPSAAAGVGLAGRVVAKGLSIRCAQGDPHALLRLYAADLERIKKLIRESFDIPLPQVKIEARMEILDRNALEQIGIMWGGGAVGAGRLARARRPGLPGRDQPRADRRPRRLGIVLPDGFAAARPNAHPPPGNVTAGPPPGKPNPIRCSSAFLPVSASTGLPLGGNLVNLPISALPNAGPLPGARPCLRHHRVEVQRDLALQALAEQGKTRTLARPEIVTVENNKAIMSLGEENPLRTVSSAGTQIQFKEALLKLEVTPTVIREGDVNKIKMLVVVENNSRGTVVNLGNSGNPPAINKRKAETLVLVNEGQRLVIGGVATSTDSNTTPQGAGPRRHAPDRLAFKQRESLRAGPRAGGLRHAERPSLGPSRDRPGSPRQVTRGGVGAPRRRRLSAKLRAADLRHARSRSYDIVVERGALASVGTRLRALRVGSRAALFTDPGIANRSRRIVAESLSGAGFTVNVRRAPEGEAAKTLAVAAHGWDAASRPHWIAAPRSWRWAAVQSATSRASCRPLHARHELRPAADDRPRSGRRIERGKTAIDHAKGKNMIGAFHQPVSWWSTPPPPTAFPAAEYPVGTRGSREARHRTGGRVLR
jgi:hypothetical protein